MKREEELTVSVKAIEWVNGIAADTIVGTYSINRLGCEWNVMLQSWPYSLGREIDKGKASDFEAALIEAKEAARIDYESRILSTLVPGGPHEYEYIERQALRAIRYLAENPSGREDHDRFAMISGYCDQALDAELTFSPLLPNPKPEATEGGAHEKGWKPIETAPIHEVCLLWEPHSMDGFTFCGVQLMDKTFINNLDQRVQRPTHWMPLPSAPAALTAKQTDGREG